MKHIFYDYAHTLEQICNKYELKTLSGKIETLKSEMDSFCLRLLFVGAFSAGKSALINATLEREILAENQNPETAIASELVYDDREYIEAIKKDEKIQYEINQADKINIQEYDYLVWHINNELLRRNTDCIIVDMPGFNSGIQSHNNAILNYVGGGNAYILVIDCEDGAIRHSIGEFIQEIKNYDNNAAVVITKTDLKMPSDVERVKKSVTSGAVDLFGKDVDVVTTGKFDDEAPRKIEAIMNSFNHAVIFSHQYLPSLYSIASECLDAVKINENSIDFDTDEFDRRIELHHEAEMALYNKLERERENLENRFNCEVSKSVIFDVESALYNNIDRLVSALKGGAKNFSVTVNNLLRPVLYNSVKTYSEEAFNNFLSEFNFEPDSVIDSSMGDVDVSLQHYREIENKLMGFFGREENFAGLYKIITIVLSSATDIVAPWLELIVIFLPDILRTIGKVREESELKNKITNQIIPEIKSKLEPEIYKTIKQIKDQLLEESEKEIKELINNEVEALEIAKERKTEYSDEINSRLADLAADRSKVEEIINALQ